MPFFRKPEPSPGDRPRLTINGVRQTLPEATGRFPRRFRLFIECERRLAGDPLAQPNALGCPVGDGHGLEGLVAKLNPLFEREESLIRWVALRGALAEISIRILDNETAVRSPNDLEAAMGLEWAPDGQGASRADISGAWHGRLTAEQRESALGIASSVLIRAEDYRRLESKSIQDVIADHSYWMSRPIALDCIAWSAIALLRLEVAQQVVSQVPEPDALVAPGWYTEPLFAKSERYWDGSDWSSRCRVQDGRQFQETTVPLA